jgi:segregation and condensation protein B
LLEKDLVVIAGRNENSPGKPLIYATSKSFMDYFGINSPDDLPKINEILNREIIEATRIEQIQMDNTINIQTSIDLEFEEEKVEEFSQIENDPGKVLDPNKTIPE